MFRNRVLAILLSVLIVLLPVQQATAMSQAATTWPVYAFESNFSPKIIDIPVSSADGLKVIDLTDSPVLQPIISGNTGVAGATLSFTDGTAQTAASDGGGKYAFPISSNWTGTVTVSRAGYTFASDHIDYANVTVNQTGQNYTPDQVIHHISGSAGIAGASLAFNDGAPQVATSGDDRTYTLLVPDQWAGAITPSKNGVVFTPSSRSYSSTPVTTDLTNQNFVAILTSTFTSQAKYDGWILESTETSKVGGAINATATTFRLGDDAADKQYRSILSFNTASLPENANISKVTLKIKQYPPTGANLIPTFQGVVMDIKKGVFGAKVNLEPGDFQAAAGKALSAVKPVPVSGLYTINLSSAAFSYINKTGYTQIRLRFQLDDNDNNVANFMSFCNGNAPSNKPQLIITYTVP